MSSAPPAKAGQMSEQLNPTTVCEAALSLPVSYAEVAHSASVAEHKFLSSATADTAASASATAFTKNPSKKSKARAIIVGRNNTAELDVAPRLKWLHLSSFKPSVTADNIKAYVSKHSSIESSKISCYRLVKGDVSEDTLEWVNFKLGISSTLYDILLNSDLWPADVKVRPFKFFQHPGNVEVGT